MAKLNPVFSGIKVDEGIETAASVKGVAIKTIFLLVIAVISAVASITVAAPMIMENPMSLFVICIVALVCGVLGQLNPNAAKVASVIYAVCEGALLGLVSFAFDAMTGGIVMTAVLLTATIFGVMLFLYSTNIVKVTGRFIKAMIGIGISIFVMGVIYIISSIVSPGNILVAAFTYNTGLMIGVSALILIYGAFMLVLDFEEVSIIVANGFDKKYEWTAALGLMVTIVWIYLEVLRLLAIFANRD